VGAPEGTDFVTTGLNVVNVSRSASMVQQGRSLQISAPSGSKLQLFSVMGKAIMNQTVTGNASVSLNKIPCGIYVAKLIGQNGKVLLSKKVSVR